MTNNEKAVNLKLRLLQIEYEAEQLREQIEGLITVRDMKEPEEVEVNPAMIEAALEHDNIVGSVLRYKDIEISLHTEPKHAGNAIFRRAMEGRR